MVTSWVKHMETPEEMNAGPAIMVSRSSFGLACNYIIDEQNGNDPVVVTGRFPADKYAPLDYTPVNSPNRFLGWFTTAVEPTVEADTSGRQLQPSEQVVFEVPYIYAHWQLPANVTFDATTNGGTLPGGAFHYYVGQPFGTLPRPTHPTLNFLGWFDKDGNKVTSSTIVTDGVVLTAQYVAAMYEVDLNGQWELASGVTNPDPSAYDGVYQSFSNYGVDNDRSTMKIHVVGLTDFRIYLRNSSEVYYDFVVAFQPDCDPSDMSWNTIRNEASEMYQTGEYNNFIAGSGYGREAGGGGIETYIPVDYALDGGEHWIWVVYGKDSSSSDNDDRGYVLISKVQGGAA